MFASSSSADGGGRREIDPKDITAADLSIQMAREVNNKVVVTPEEAEATAMDLTDELRAAIKLRLSESAAQALRQLDFNEAAETLTAFEIRFKANMHLHEGLSWDRVKKALKAAPHALWSINKMQAAGHDPDVYNFDENGFDIGSCSEESPQTGRNCVYDDEATVRLGKINPEEVFSGSAVEMAKSMGVKLMTPTLYKVLQSKGEFDKESGVFLDTEKSTRQNGDALRGFRDGNNVYFLKLPATDHFKSRAWRGTIRVNWHFES